MFPRPSPWVFLGGGRSQACSQQDDFWAKHLLWQNLPARLGKKALLRVCAGCDRVSATRLSRHPWCVWVGTRQEVSGSKEQLFWWIFFCLWHGISLWGKGVSSLHGQRGYKGWARWCGGIPLVGATWPPCIRPLEREVSDAAEKERASPAVVQSVPCVFLGTLVQSKGDIHLPGLLSVARLGSRKIWVWITSCCWVRKCKMPLRCAVPPVLGCQTNFPPSCPLSEFSSSYFVHYFQSLQLYFQGRSRKK